MERRVSLITLGVTDLQRAREFYRRLGWQGQETEETVFIQAGALGLVLWSRAKLALDAGVPDERVPDGGPPGFGGMVLAHNVRSPAEVDEVMATARTAGATITCPAATTFYGGYAGYFADPDGHLWEIAHNPGFPLAPDGSITIPDFGPE
ncbi:VOC family protein [Pengzhenrongella sp.]|jgi:catechol 2,3-dioxygenase-like lactoylglutathione lyase family enzyme|uniref:VOC family protein n=1 Tax=Pengzhenrongella sp. TaxID=2888820 RepID=UPI002F930EE8